MMSKYKVVPWTPRPEVLLCPQIPKPMHGVSPRVVMGQPWWDSIRKAAYRSTDYHCIACRVEQAKAKELPLLEGHELYEIDYPRGRMIYRETVPLCHYCHNYIHKGRLEVLMIEKTIPRQKFDAVMAHGEQVILEARLTIPRPYQGPCAWWGDWRMVLNGQLYEPVYKTESDWIRQFRPTEEF